MIYDSRPTKTIYKQKTCKWFMSLETRKPLACLLPANGLSLSILMGNLNHSMENVCKWFASLYCLERRKPFACHMQIGLSKLFISRIFIKVAVFAEVFHLNIFIRYILDKYVLDTRQSLM